MAWLIFRGAKAVSDLSERLEKVERDMRALELEAGELYEKAKHALGRATKRDAVDVATGRGGPDGRPSHIDPKSWDIILRRKGGVGPSNRG